MKRRILAAVTVAAASVLVACGGGAGTPPSGGSGGSSPTPSSGGSPTSTPSSGPATASGVLIDHDTGAHLAGIAVGLAPWTAGATPIPQGTTDPQGRFNISAPSPGKYLLVIGSDSPNDPNNRPTIHDAVTLVSGSQLIAAPTMPPVPSTTPNPIEESGNFRLTTLTANEQACFAYENQKRAGLSYAPAVADEWLVENMRMEVEEETVGGRVGGGGALTNYNGGDGLGCTDMINNDYGVTLNMGNPNLIWYAGNEVSATNGAVDEGMLDPRGPLPSPTPPNPWP